MILTVEHIVASASQLFTSYYDISIIFWLLGQGTEAQSYLL